MVIHMFCQIISELISYIQSFLCKSNNSKWDVPGMQWLLQTWSMARTTSALVTGSWKPEAH